MPVPPQQFYQRPVYQWPGFAHRLSAAVLLWALTQSPAALAEPIDEHTSQMLVGAVEAAFELDLYNSRCRSDVSGRSSSNLNKELVSRYRITAINVQDDYFPEAGYRDAHARMEADFLNRLRELGGCPGAKETGLRDILRERYQKAMSEVARQP